MGKNATSQELAESSEHEESTDLPRLRLLRRQIDEQDVWIRPQAVEDNAVAIGDIKGANYRGVAEASLTA